MRTLRGTRVIQTLPKNTGWPELDKAADKYRKLVGDERACQHRIVTLEEQREGAIRADTQAMAQALSSGKKAKADSSALERVEKEIAETRRELQAYEIAIDNAENELYDLVAAHREEWVEEVEPQIETARQSYREAIDALEAARWALSEQIAMVRFLKQFAEGEARAYLVTQRAVLGLKAPHGDPYNWDKVVGALRTDAEPVEPPREAIFGGGYAPYATLKGNPNGGLMHDEGVDLEEVAY